MCLEPKSSRSKPFYLCECLIFFWSKCRIYALADVEVNVHDRSLCPFFGTADRTLVTDDTF